MSSRGESLRMIAEVSLSASGGTNAVVGGRPLNLWWAEVQPFVRTVLLAPQPSTKVDRVSWSWTQGARSVTASRPEMVAIRRDLEESAAALVAAVPKEAKLRTVFDAYAELLRALASRSNTELERYVCGFIRGCDPANGSKRGTGNQRNGRRHGQTRRWASRGPDRLPREHDRAVTFGCKWTLPFLEHRVRTIPFTGCIRSG